MFAPEFDGLDRDEIRRWYNGYSWLGTERLYNPFDVLLLFDDRKFNPYWFRIGSPRFLFETLKAKSVSSLELEGCLADESLVSKFEIEDISADALLFQTGYLTITDEIRRGHRTFYRLDCPNQEVRLSLNDELLAHLSPRNRVPLEEGEILHTLLEATSEALRKHSRPIWPVFPISGTRPATSPAMKPGMPVCCICVSALLEWMCGQNRPQVVAVRTR